MIWVGCAAQTIETRKETTFMKDKKAIRRFIRKYVRDDAEPYVPDDVLALCVLNDVMPSELRETVTIDDRITPEFLAYISEIHFEELADYDI